MSILSRDGSMKEARTGGRWGSPCLSSQRSSWPMARPRTSAPQAGGQAGSQKSVMSSTSRMRFLIARTSAHHQVDVGLAGLADLGELQLGDRADELVLGDGAAVDEFGAVDAEDQAIGVAELKAGH